MNLNLSNDSFILQWWVDREMLAEIHTPEPSERS